MDLAQPLKLDSEYHRLAEVVIEIKKLRADWDEYMKPIRKATKEAHSIACAQFNEINDQLEEIVERAEPLLFDYEQRRDAQRSVEENKLNAEIQAQRDPADNSVPLTVTLPKLTAPSGLVRRSTWRAEVKNFQELVLAVAAGEVPLAYLKPDEQTLNLQARAFKNEMKIPGVIPVEDVGYAAKGNR